MYIITFTGHYEQCGKCKRFKIEYINLQNYKNNEFLIDDTVRLIHIYGGELYV